MAGGGRYTGPTSRTLSMDGEGHRQAIQQEHARDKGLTDHASTRLNANPSKRERVG